MQFRAIKHYFSQIFKGNSEKNEKRKYDIVPSDGNVYNPGIYHLIYL